MMLTFYLKVQGNEFFRKADRLDGQCGGFYLDVTAGLLLVPTIDPTPPVTCRSPIADSLPSGSAATLTLSTAEVRIGDSYVATATGFSPGEHVRFSWTGLSRGVIGDVVADSYGRASVQVREGAAAGDYRIIATGLASGRETATALRVVA